MLFAKILAILVGLVVTVAVIAGAWFVWQLHPWVPAGRALALGDWRFGDYEFQVWQRKNPDTFEPFADGILVRHGTNEWQAFCFDIQDGYSPRVNLQQEHSEIVVYRSGEERGRYDMITQTFRRGGSAFTPTDVIGNPPGDWWLRP